MAKTFDMQLVYILLPTAIFITGFWLTLPRYGEANEDLKRFKRFHNDHNYPL